MSDSTSFHIGIIDHSSETEINENSYKPLRKILFNIQIKIINLKLNKELKIHLNEIRGNSQLFQIFQLNVYYLFIYFNILHF